MEMSCFLVKKIFLFCFCFQVKQFILSAVRGGSYSNMAVSCSGSKRPFIVKEGLLLCGINQVKGQLPSYC